MWSLTREEVLKRCYATGAPAGPLNNIADIYGDRQFHARRNLVAIDDEDLGETIIVPAVIPLTVGNAGANPPSRSQTRTAYRGGAQ